MNLDIVVPNFLLVILIVLLIVPLFILIPLLLGCVSYFINYLVSGKFYLFVKSILFEYFDFVLECLFSPWENFRKK